MRVLLLTIAITLGSAGRTVEKAKGGGPGTQTVLLIKGGVGFDVNLLSTSPQTVRRSSKDTSANQWTLDIKDEQKVASELTASLQNTVDSSKKLEDQVHNLKARALKAEKLLSQKDQELKKLQQKEAAAEKSLQVKSKMLLHERHESDLLKKKVNDLEQDIEISGRAWKEAANHEKEVAEEAQETAREEAAKNDRLSQQMDVKPQKKMTHAAPKAKPSHGQFMKTLKKQPVKLAKAVPQTDNEIDGSAEEVDESIAPKVMESADSDNMPEESAPVDEADIDMQEDIAPDAADAISDDRTEIPSEDEPMPVAEEQPVAKEQPVKQAKKTVMNPTMIHASSGAAGVQENGNTDETVEDSSVPAPDDDINAEDKVVDSSTEGLNDPSIADAQSAASKDEDSNWDFAYTAGPQGEGSAAGPGGRAATVEDSVEGDVGTKESEDVLSSDAPMPVEEDPNDPVQAEPDLMGRV